MAQIVGQRGLLGSLYCRWLLRRRLMQALSSRVGQGERNLAQRNGAPVLGQLTTLQELQRKLGWTASRDLLRKDLPDRISGLDRNVDGPFSQRQQTSSERRRDPAAGVRPTLGEPRQPGQSFVG